MPRLLAVVGPTAVGKTALAVAIAHRLGAAELVNADSRQVIRGLRVGTCAPRPEELGGVPCHLLGVREAGAPFSVAEWARLAACVLRDLDLRRVRPILVGGTGLYVAAILDGLELAGGAPDREVRRRRDALSESDAGLSELVEELRLRDPAGAATVDVRNRRRVVRALELVDALGSVAAGRRRNTGRPATVIGLDAPAALHRELVTARVAAMFRSGDLEREVESAIASGIPPAALEAAGIGYGEALAVRAGRMSVEAAVAEVTVRTMRYAKAQRTWFRRDARIQWLRRDEEPADALVERAIGILAREEG